MKTNKRKCTRNNPDPIEFVQIKNEPQPHSRQGAKQPDVIVESVRRSNRPTKNNPNPTQFQVKQEPPPPPSLTNPINVNSSITVIATPPITSSVACQAQDDTAIQQITRLTARSDEQSLEIERLSKENETKSTKILQLEEENAKTIDEKNIEIEGLKQQVKDLEQKIKDLEQKLVLSLPTCIETTSQTNKVYIG